MATVINVLLLCAEVNDWFAFRLKHAHQEIKKKETELKKTEQEYKKDQAAQEAVEKNMEKLQAS